MTDDPTTAACCEALERLALLVDSGECRGLVFVALDGDGTPAAVGTAGTVTASPAHLLAALARLTAAVQDKARECRH